MTAVRIVEAHAELENSGQVPHSTIDTYLTGSAFLVVSGSGPLPPTARRLKQGPGVSFDDQGPGGNFTISATSALTGSSISWMETPSGDVDGVNLTFLLANTPTPTLALMFFVNGVLQKQGAGSDYLLSGSTITSNYTYRSGSNLAATYPY